MADRKVKVLPIRRFNIVHLIFFLFFIYMVIIVGKYMLKEEIKICEVTEGSLTQNHNYTGLILRTEKLLYAEEDGFIKCYVNDGDRISKDGVAFAIDKTGDNLKSSSSSTASSITEEQYRSLRKYLNQFSNKYEGQDFSNVYTFKDQLRTALYGMEQEKAGESDKDTGLFFQKAAISGVVYFTMDGLESLSEDTVTRESLEHIAFSSARVLTGDSVEKKKPVCKIISNEKWEIIVPITEKDAEYYADKKTAEVLLTDIDCKTNAEITVYEDQNGERLARLVLDKYMSSYAADRLISFQLLKPVTSGLKVPKTSVVSRELYMVPLEYGSVSKSKVIFFRKTAGEEEEISKEAVTVSICYADSQYYYIDNRELKSGDILFQTDETGNVTGDGYKVGEKKTLEGVYNVNKGYTVFEVVETLDSNDSYCIVKGGTKYGLAVYDHIVLNASTVNEDDLLY